MYQMNILHIAYLWINLTNGQLLIDKIVAYNHPLLFSQRDRFSTIAMNVNALLIDKSSRISLYH